LACCSVMLCLFSFLARPTQISPFLVIMTEASVPGRKLAFFAAIISLVRDWARDGLLLIGDAAHTMSPAGAIGVNVALATAAVAAQEIHPRLGRGPIPRDALANVQRLREADVRNLHTLQRAAGRVLQGAGRRASILRWVAPIMLPVIGRTWIMPRLQRRLFFGVPLPPLDPAFGFRAEAAAPAPASKQPAAPSSKQPHAPA